MISNQIIVRELGVVDYQPTYEAMQLFTQQRTVTTPDEIWLLQHPPVYTQGRNGKAEHLLKLTNIPVVPIDRGGQITYHGPGQWIAYLLFNLKRMKIGARELVYRSEEAIIDLLSQQQISATRKESAPGVYVNDAKIAALGFRIKNSFSYHGLSLNVDMDLTPFEHINPCGYQGLAITSLNQHGNQKTMEQIGRDLVTALLHQFEITE